MTFTMTISREELVLADLVLPQEWCEFGPVNFGGLIEQRTTASSPFVQGRLLVASTTETPNLRGEIYVLGLDPADLEDRVDTIRAALRQRRFQLSVTHTDGTSRTDSWLCERADFEEGSAGADPAASLFYQVLTYSIPRSPLATSGPWTV